MKEKVTIMEEKVIFIDVEYGRNENWLRFTGHVPRCDNSKRYIFEYCGTELNTTAIMTEAAMDNLIDCLNDDFGYAPFDINKASEVLDTYREYYIETL